MAVNSFVNTLLFLLSKGCRCVCVCVCMCVCVCIYMYVCMYGCTVCMYVSACMHIYMYVCVCVYMYVCTDQLQEKSDVCACQQELFHQVLSYVLLGVQILIFCIKCKLSHKCYKMQFS